jgi:hypothetical protein
MLKVIVFTLLSGCALTGNQDMKYGVKQPRALAWGIGMPSCLFFCTAEFSITQGERNGDATQLKGGDQSTTISPTYSPQDNDVTTLSP